MTKDPFKQQVTYIITSILMRILEYLLRPISLHVLLKFIYKLSVSLWNWNPNQFLID